MSYTVYKVRNNLAIQDPDMGGKRYHTILFVETESDSSGTIHHVIGDIVTGMQYESRKEPAPESSAVFHSKEFLGRVLIANYPDDFQQVCLAQPPPPPQKKFNPKTYRTEQVEPDGTFYSPGEPRPPMIKCTEWTENQAIPALIASGFIRK
jgi:hypothetical protein